MTIKAHFTRMMAIAGFFTATLLILLSGMSVMASDNIIPVREDVMFSTDDTSKVYRVVEEMPQIVGGLQAVYDNIEYPRAAISGGVEGKVYIKFIIDEKGRVQDPQILKDIGSGCGEAALAGIRKVKFTPGKQNGVAVRVHYTLPVTFQIKS